MVLYRLYQEVIGKINMENYKISLRTITEDNFIEAFNLKLANGQERFVSHQFEALHRLMFTEINVSRLEFIKIIL